MTSIDVNDKTKVLIKSVDDNFIESISKAIVLNTHNIDILTCIENEDIFEKIQKSDIDLIVYDLLGSNSNSNFKEFIKGLKAIDEDDNIYLLSFYNSEDDVDFEYFKEYNNIDFIQLSSLEVYKEFKLNSIIKKLEKYPVLLDIIKQSKLNNQKLKEELEKYSDLLISLVQARHPLFKEIILKVKKASQWIGEQMKLKDEEKVLLTSSSELIYIGKLSLDDENFRIPVLKDGIPSNEKMFNVPKEAYRILSESDFFNQIAEILLNIYENFDGTGIPDKKQSWQIPMISRIIRVSIDYYESEFILKMNQNEILENINNFAGRFYDKRIANLITQYILSNDNDIRDNNYVPYKLFEVEENMILAHDILTQAGFKMLSAGAILTTELIKKLIKHNTTDPILGYILIKEN